MRKIFLFGLLLLAVAAGFGYAESVGIVGSDLVASGGTSIVYAPAGYTIKSLQLIPYDPTNVAATLLATQPLEVAVYTTSGSSQWALAATFHDAIVGAGAVGGAAVSDTIMHLDLGGVKGVKLVGTLCLADSVACTPWYTIEK